MKIISRYEPLNYGNAISSINEHYKLLADNNLDLSFLSIFVPSLNSEPYPDIYILTRIF